MKGIHGWRLGRAQWTLTLALALSGCGGPRSEDTDPAPVDSDSAADQTLPDSDGADSDSVDSDRDSVSDSDESSDTDGSTNTDGSSDSDTESVSDSDSSSASSAFPVPVTIFMHSEDSSHAHTADFTEGGTALRQASSYRTYVGFRRVLVAFADRMQEAGVSWNFQPDWNFTNGVLKYEVDAYTAPTGGAATDFPTVSALLAESGGKNVYRYLVEDLGVIIDPHSHEGAPMGREDYNYADVACLIAETGVIPSRIVGGHVIESRATPPPGNLWQQWPRFKSALNGTTAHSGDRHVGASCSWTARALMGGGTASHAGENKASGIWLPQEPPGWATADIASSTDFGGYYFQIDHSSSLPAIGTYEAENLDTLIANLESGALPVTELFNATQGVNHSDLAEAAYGSLNTTDGKTVTNLATFASGADAGVGPVEAARIVFESTVEPLLTRRAAGEIELLTLEGVLRRWETEFSSWPSLCVDAPSSATHDCVRLP